MSECEKHHAKESHCHAESEPADACHVEASRPDYFLWMCVGLVVLAYVLHLTVAMPAASMVHHFVAGVVDLFNRMWWGLALGAVFVGLLGKVPRDLVMAVLGRDTGLQGLCRATAAGVALDLCSHGILAVGMKLYERGANIGQVVAFLLASPWNSLSLTLILIALIGWQWTLLFVVLSMVVGIITGALFDMLVAREKLPPNPVRASLNPDERPVREQWSAFRADWHFSWRGLGRVVVDGLRGARIVIRWALFGVLLAAAIRAAVPAESYATWFGATAAGLWLTLLAATVIEVCSEGSTPIAADLLTRAHAPGNSFTFLMAGVATDYTEIMSLRDTTRSWAIALALPLLTVPQVMLVGAVLNRISVG